MHLLKKIFGLVIILLLANCAHRGYIPLDNTEIDPQKRRQYHTPKDEMMQNEVPLAELPEGKLRNIKSKSGFSEKRYKRKKAKSIAWRKWPPRKEKRSILAWIRRPKEKDK